MHIEARLQRLESVTLYVTITGVDVIPAQAGIQSVPW